jgi:hypothetical protein
LSTHQTILLWAREVAEHAGITKPERLLDPPNGVTAVVAWSGHVTVRRFAGGFYRDLPDLLDGHIGGAPLPGHPPRATPIRTPTGDPVTAADLARTHVIAFELNGGFSAASGGWESCRFVFDDGGSTPVTVNWDERIGAVRPGAIIANGSIDGDRYSEFFGITPPTTTPGPDQSLVVSYLLFALPTLDVSSPQFKIRLEGHLTQTGESEGSPDADAIGVIACSNER